MTDKLPSDERVERLARELFDFTQHPFGSDMNWRNMARFILAREQEARKEATAAGLELAAHHRPKMVKNDYCWRLACGGCDWDVAVSTKDFDQHIRALIPAEDSDLLAEVKRKERETGKRIGQILAVEVFGVLLAEAEIEAGKTLPGAFRELINWRKELKEAESSAPQHEKQRETEKP